MQTLASFSSKLRQLAGSAEGIRPLLCAGSPLDCNVALIGANPGTSTPFWPFWSDDKGMDKAGWLQEYLRQHGKYNRSRAAIERFVPQVKGKVIELNAHAKQSERLAELGAEHRTTEILHFIMRSVRPKVAICAGSDALRAVEAMKVDWPMSIFPVKHFIYWGKDMERELAQRVNAAPFKLA